METLLQASFPRPGEVSRVRELIEADVGVNDLGVGAYRSGEAVQITYPITVVVGTKPAQPGALPQTAGA